MDSMAIQAVIFQKEYIRVIQTYKNDSTSFTNQIKSDSVYIEVLETDNEKLSQALDKEKPKKKWWGISGIILGLLSQLLF